jgi:phytoene synthase
MVSKWLGSRISDPSEGLARAAWKDNLLAMSDPEPHLSLLPPEHRLALAYAPTGTRADWLAVLSLDARLARIVRGAREPLLAQMRLAWWREQFAQPGLTSAKEPLLAPLAAWNGAGGALIALVDGWEVLLGQAPLDGALMAEFVEGRAAALGSLAERLGSDGGASRQAARGWALVDLLGRLTHPDEQGTVAEMVARHRWDRAGLARSMRPLAVLHGLARNARGDGRLLATPASFVRAIRLGLFGF